MRPNPRREDDYGPQPSNPYPWPLRFHLLLDNWCYFEHLYFGQNVEVLHVLPDLAGFDVIRHWTGNSLYLRARLALTKKTRKPSSVMV